MKLLKYIFFIVIGLPPTMLYSQVLTLDSITNTIKKSHPDLQMYDLQMKALNSYAAGAKSWDAPQIGTGLYMTPYNLAPNMGSWMFTIQQMIPNPAKLKANQNYMQSMSSVEQQTKNYEENQLLSQAKMNYFEWLVLKQKQLILKNNEDLLAFIIKVSEARYAYEKEKLNSIYKAKAALAELNNMQLMIENDILQKRISLNTLMNRDKNQLFEIDTNFIIQNYENELVDTTTLSHQRSDIKQFNQSIQVSLLKQKFEESKRKPDFGIRYDHATAFGSQPNQFSVMGMISIPIVPWSAKMFKANIKGLIFEVQAIEKQRESALNEANGMIQSLQQQIKSKKKQVKLYQDNIISALNNNYKTTLLAYEQNTEELFMVLDAWQSLQMAQLEYMNQLKDLLLLQVEFENKIEKK